MKKTLLVDMSPGEGCLGQAQCKMIDQGRPHLSLVFALYLVLLQGLPASLASVIERNIEVEREMVR